LSYKRIVNRTRREDWLEQGFVVLREGGEAALTIDRLCKDLGRTKGAFYHHFADVNVYTDALLTAWEERNSSSAPPARADGRRRGVVESHARSLDVPLDRSFRAWGLRDERARQFVARVDDRRIASLASTYPPAIPLAVRRKLARLEYAVFVGVQQLYPDLSGAAARDLERMLQTALSAVAGHHKRAVSAGRLSSASSRSRAS
jgi:AcrR family transcriptional regulator